MSTPPTIPGSAPLPLKGEVTAHEPGRERQSIARRAAETRATVPDLELSTDADGAAMHALMQDTGCSSTAVLVAACAAALAQRPRANAAYRDGRYESYSRVNIGVVLPTAEAQLTATVLDADTKPLAQLEDELSDLRRRALAGELASPQQAGATFTLLDLGPYGIDRGVPLLTPPQAAALTAGAVRAVPVLRNGTVVPGHRLTLTLACDHRILFGAEAAELLAAIASAVARAA